MEKISEIWVINENGITLFNKSLDVTVDPALFGGFLGAIRQFVELSFKGSKLDKLHLGETKISFLHEPDHHIFIVIRSHKKVNDKEIAKYLEKVCDLFVTNYADKLKGTMVDVSYFKSFDKILEDAIEKEKLVNRMTNWLEEV